MRFDCLFTEKSATMSITKKSPYIYSLDAMRALAALAVVSLHTEPFASVNVFENRAFDQALAAVCSVLALFAVPFFFTASGYCLGAGIHAGREHTRAFTRFVLRALLLFSAWSLAYSLVYFSPGRAAPELERFSFAGLTAIANMFGSQPGRYALHGGCYHLWFLSSLAQVAILTWLFTCRNANNALLWLAMGLYVLGLFGQSYAKLLPLELPCNTRVGPFFGFLPFVLGYRLAFTAAPDLRRSRQMIIVGSLLLALEAAVLWCSKGAAVGHYYFGSIPLAYGLLCFCLNRPSWGASTFLPRLGRASLGVYAVHVLFVGAMEEQDWLLKDTWFWQLVAPFMILFCAWLLVEVLVRLPGGRYMVGGRMRPKSTATAPAYIPFMPA